MRVARADPESALLAAPEIAPTGCSLPGPAFARSNSRTGSHQQALTNDRSKNHPSSSLTFTLRPLTLPACSLRSAAAAIWRSSAT